MNEMARPELVKGSLVIVRSGTKKEARQVLVNMSD